QYRVTDVAAIKFSREFYSQLAFGLTVDQAMTLARSQLPISLPNTPEWATPVLYLGPKDGQLFGLQLTPQELLAHIRVRFLNCEWDTVLSVAALLRAMHPRAPKEGGEARGFEKFAQACQAFAGAWQAAEDAHADGEPVAGQVARLARQAQSFPREELRDEL